MSLSADGGLGDWSCGRYGRKLLANKILHNKEILLNKTLLNFNYYEKHFENDNGSGCRIARILELQLL